MRFFLFGIPYRWQHNTSISIGNSAGSSPSLLANAGLNDSDDGYNIATIADSFFCCVCVRACGTVCMAVQGGASVSSHLVMSESFPLFHKAIIESGNRSGTKLSLGSTSNSCRILPRQAWVGGNYGVFIETKRVQAPSRTGARTAGRRRSATGGWCSRTKASAAQPRAARK